MRQTDNFSILLSKDVKYVFVCFTDLQMVVAVFPYLKMMLVEYVKKTQQIQIDLPHPDCTDAVPITEQIVKKYEG